MLLCLINFSPRWENKSKLHIEEYELKSLCSSQHQYWKVAKQFKFYHSKDNLFLTTIIYPAKMSMNLIGRINVQSM